MDYSFNTKLAEQYGVEEAVLLNHLYFWIQHNTANKKHLHDGRYWTYNSAQAFTEIFPFWSRQKIDRMIQGLRESGAIIVGNYNESGQDRTRWFSLAESVVAIAENRPTHCSELSNSLPKSEQPLPDSKPDINTYTLSTSDFETFWKAYPKKKSRDAAKRAFEKLARSKSAPTIDKLIGSVSEHLNTPEWKKDGGQYIPYPATYLNAGSYDDEIVSSPQEKPKAKPAPMIDEKGNLLDGTSSR
ncbi:MAG: hypothetical protein VB062_04720 [Christensenella sp.]|nr:hypothetical protein [Christensenella sp.]